MPKKIREDHSVVATVIPCDLATIVDVDQLCDELRKRTINIDTLVNNAGFGALGKFAELSIDRQTDMLMVNVVSLTRLTRALLPAMIQRGKGGELNVGSIAAYQAGPNMAVYYASKAYVLSRNLAIKAIAMTMTLSFPVGRIERWWLAPTLFRDLQCENWLTKCKMLASLSFCTSASAMSEKNV